MRFTKYIAILSLCLFIKACDLYKGDLEIDIGDYENHLEAWNSQNMLDYQMRVYFSVSHNGGILEGTVINVRNGIPKSSDPPERIEAGGNLTIPEFYSFIKEIEESYRDSHKESNGSYSLKVMYNTEYYYPCEIKYTHSREQSGSKGAWSRVTWTIYVTPLGDLEIDIGDFENQLEAWNSLNMLDYQLDVEYSDPFNLLSSHITVRNGIPESYTNYWWMPDAIPLTIPKSYALINKIKKDITDKYESGSHSSYGLKATYNTEYHYPDYIALIINGTPTEERTITLTSSEETEQETGNSEEYNIRRQESRE
jgi:hypothetical protein